MTTAMAFWKNGIFAECVPWESVTPVLILSQEALKQLALSVVTGQDDFAYARVVSKEDSQRMKLVILCVRVYENT